MWIVFFVLAFIACSDDKNDNQPPNVNVGEDITIRLPENQVQLDALVIDDGLPEGTSLSYFWEQQSGPGNVSFTVAASQNTTATFNVAGTYVLQLQVSDSELTGSDTVTITVNNQADQTYTVTITKTGTGAGSVTSEHAGIDCGSDCSETVNENSTILLNAIPETGSAFAGWQGADCSGTGACEVTVGRDYTVTANFNLNGGQDDNSTVPGNPESYQNVHTIGFEWPITGDENHNAECTVKYRIQGSLDWNKALPLFRIAANEFNMLAGSILYLNEATSYEVELTLNDPDGGYVEETVTITTRSYPSMPTNGTTYYVSPGTGGGNGSVDSPFLGLESAEATASPGDIFLLNSGDYTANNGERYKFRTSGTADQYVVWKNAPGETPVLREGARILGDYIWLEGVTIRDLDYGLLTENGYEPDGAVIKGNRFHNCHYSIQLNHGGKNWFFLDNIIEGDVEYSSGDLSGEGIELQRTSGHVVAYNEIYNVADGVSYPLKNCDIYNNEIYNVSDDGIELDFGWANNRAWNNRITNSMNNGISIQNLSGYYRSGAPQYVIRNQVIVGDGDGLKLRDNVDVSLIAHNSFICRSGVVSSSASLLTRLQANNNLWISVRPRYVWEDMSSATTPDYRTFLDYNGFDWENNVYSFKWKNTRLRTLEDFQTFSGLELHSISVSKADVFENFNVPDSENDLAPVESITLSQTGNAIDAGLALDNINDGYAGDAPDLGPYEYGQAIPEYGPRN